MQQRHGGSCSPQLPHSYSCCLVVAQHLPLRCHRWTCHARDKVVWANFVADARGSYTWLDGSARSDVAMLSPTFGVTWEWHAQFSKRILHHHACSGGRAMSCYVHAFAGGWLVACAGDGRVLHVMEFVGGEPPHAESRLRGAKCGYPTLHTILQDDACHLRQFMGRWCSTSPELCFFQMHYIIDRFHSKSHTDKWCRESCSPFLPQNETRIQSHNSSACELLFSWFSAYKPSFRHGSADSTFFMHEVLLMKNTWLQSQQRSA